MKNSKRLPVALILVLVLLAALALGACSRPLFIDEDAESTAAAEVLTRFMMAMGEGNISQAFNFFASGQKNVTAEGLATLLMDRTKMFVDVQRVEISSFTISDDPDSKSKLRARMTGLIHYNEDIRLFSSELIKDSGSWFLVNVTFSD